MQWRHVGQRKGENAEKEANYTEQGDSRLPWEKKPACFPWPIVVFAVIVMDTTGRRAVYAAKLFSQYPYPDKGLIIGYPGQCHLRIPVSSVRSYLFSVPQILHSVRPVRRRIDQVERIRDDSRRFLEPVDRWNLIGLL